MWIQALHEHSISPWFTLIPLLGNLFLSNQTGLTPQSLKRNFHVFTSSVKNNQDGYRNNKESKSVLFLFSKYELIAWPQFPIGLHNAHSADKHVLQVPLSGRG